MNTVFLNAPVIITRPINWLPNIVTLPKMKVEGRRRERRKRRWMDCVAVNTRGKRIVRGRCAGRERVRNSDPSLQGTS